MRIPHLTLWMGRVAVLLLVTCIGSRPTLAGTTQVVMFTGFGSIFDPNPGMDVLNAELATLGVPEYQGKVFTWSDQQGAFDWLQQFEANRSTLAIIGHSFGGNGALQLAGEYLLPAGIDVDLTVQIDSVSNPNPGSNSSLPPNVEVGFNYYQVGTGLFETIEGEDFVNGATNINAEVLFNDMSITHTSIDNDPRLHALIGQHIFDNLNLDSADFDTDGFVAGEDFRSWQVGFGATGSAMLSDGDANGDGDVDDEDLAIWRQQYGSVPPLAVASVPEPTGLAIMVSLALCGFAWNRNRS